MQGHRYQTSTQIQCTVTEWLEGVPLDVILGAIADSFEERAIWTREKRLSKASAKLSDLANKVRK